MDRGTFVDVEPPSPSPPPFLSRAATRRALLASGAAIAAAGAAGTLVALGMRGTETPPPSGGGISNAGGGKQAGAPAEELQQPIADARRRAAHLLRRAGFGGTRAQIAEFAGLSREDGADRLLNFETADNSALDGMIAKAGYNLVDNPADVQRWWLLRMAYSARPLEERMTFTWHGLLTSQMSKIGGQRAKLMVLQNELFRANALPKWDAFVKAVSRDPAMLVYLDNVESSKEHPNENYARELMELFTLGVGHYAEQDVREAARAFTGWRFTQPAKPAIDLNTLTKEQRAELEHRLVSEWTPQFTMAKARHDEGQKTFLGKIGNFDGDDIVEIIMQQPAAGRFICTRLFTEFANLNPAKETIDGLMKVWDESGKDIRAIVRSILVSDEFNSEASYRAFVRSPIELLVGALRGLEMAELRPGAVSEKAFRGMGQVLFEPPNVAGWPGGAAWLSSSTFFARVNLLDQLMFSGPGGRPSTLPALAAASAPDELVDSALEILVDDNVPDASRQALYAFARDIANVQERAAAVACLVLASPEFQLT